MGLTCSLLGHAFEADGVEREREQRGDEVVTVVRETETCSRCGAQRVVSETTEVTSVLDRDETSLDAGDTPGSDARENPAPDGETGGGRSGALGNFVDRADAEEAGEVDRGTIDRDDDAPGDASGEPTHPRVDPDATEEPYEPPEDPAEEDAEILGGGPDDDRDPGQWPDDDSPAGTPGDDPGGAADDPGEAPDATGSSDSPAPAGSRSSPGSPGSPGSAGGSGEGRFVCGECGFATPAVGSSLRAGDSCPECNTGWLAVESEERNP
jgi:ribosomal protein S27AE